MSSKDIKLSFSVKKMKIVLIFKSSKVSLESQIN